MPDVRRALLAASALKSLGIRLVNDTEKPPSEAELKQLTAELKRITDEVKQSGEKLIKEVKDQGNATAETKEKVDKALSEQATAATKLDEIKSRLDDVEQKMARRGSDEESRVKANQTSGQIFINDERVKAFCKAGERGRIRVWMPSIQAAISSVPGSAGVLVEPMRVPGIVGLPERRLTIRDLLTPGTTAQNAIQFVVETGFTNAADVVSEGAPKPESDLTFDDVTRSVGTIAHWVLASKQILDDAPMLQSHIDGRLRYGLALKEEDQLLNGDGTGANLYGIIPQASPYSQAFQPQSQTQIDTIRLALLQAELAEFPANGIVLHPIDWARIELTKDAENRYIFAQPQGIATPVLWNRPVVATQAMDVDDFLVGAFRLGAQLFDRQDAVVELSTEDGDNFRRNRVTIRAEERLALAVYRPEAFVFGDFTNTT
ncbi:phage major capsid protein [Inquilinus sp. CA228]|uniref:phage major capsid protein n=1 Tax=Inquilinus sp. CA228 TaxID=3455609 RepID=UPI003F8D719B